MVDVVELEEAVQGKIDSLRQELRYNRKILNSAEEWAKAIEQHMAAAKKCFDTVREPFCVIESDPETGQPYACVQVDVKGSLFNKRRDERRAYYRQVRLVSDARFLELIILDVNPIEEDDQE